VDKVVELLDGIAKQMGVAVQYLWPKLVAYQWAVALGDVIAFVLVLGLCGALAPFFWAKWSKGNYNDDALGTGAIVLTVFGGIAFILAVSTLPNLIATLVSPEAATLMWLVNRVGSR
jgi:hypothetical protein